VVVPEGAVRGECDECGVVPEGVVWCGDECGGEVR
jgi:hypothetical protein